jgi:cytoskeletal protein CcmA (bactofilin family)
MAFSNTYKNDSEYSGQRTLLTIVGDYAVLDGKFNISQSIEIDCELKGKLTVDGKITIQQNGFVSADVKTKEAEIIGKYLGDMEATGNVVVRETGIAMGNIKTNSLIINKGGIFNGNISRITETNVSLDETPVISAIENKPAFQEEESYREEESEKDSYNTPVFSDEDPQSASYDTSAEDDNPTL